MALRYYLRLPSRRVVSVETSTKEKILSSKIGTLKNINNNVTKIIEPEITILRPNLLHYLQPILNKSKS